MNFKFRKPVRTFILIAIIGIISFQLSHNPAYSKVRAVPVGSISGVVHRPIPVVREEPTHQEKDIFILVNYQRSIHKLKKLKWHPRLARLARNYSKKMADEDFFDHYDPEGNSVVDRADEFKIKGWEKIGENLFYSEGLISPSGEAVEGWLDSPEHRLNMLDVEWTHSAIGVYEKRGLKTYVTQVFMKK